MRKTLHLLLLAFIFSSFFACEKKSCLNKNQKDYLSENSDLMIAIFIYYPPYQFVNEDGNVDGILIDYLQVLEDKIGYKFKKKVYSSWQTLMSEAQKGNIDVILEIQNTPERRDYLTFTKPIFFGDHVIVSKEGSGINTIKDLKGKKVTVGDEYSIEEYLRKKHPELFLVPLVNEKTCLEALVADDVDAFIGLKSIANYTIKKEDFTNLKIDSPIDFKYELGMGINKNKPTLTKIIRKGSNAISLDEKNEILDKWLYNIVKPIHKKFIFWKSLLAIVFSILILSFLFSSYLKRLVKKKTLQLRRAKFKAEKSNDIKTLFLQNISHEVRTPLNSIIGFSNLLKQEEAESNNKKEYIDTIIQESSKLTTILNNIIEISELTIKKPKPQNRPISLDKELNILSDIYRSKANYKGLGFDFDNSIKKEFDHIVSDKSRLIKAISNLLDNAIKFTQNGEIKMKSKLLKDKLKITISDTGIGIRPELSKDVFHEFYQEEKELSKKYDGLGIGLSIANENIKSLGGSIELNTTEKQGATFTITLPFIASPSSSKSNGGIPKKMDSPVKILIAEDMKLNYLVLEKTLDKIIPGNKEVTWAKNGKEAVEKIEESVFDIVFMDIKMPILDGYEATKRIRSINKSIPIIAQTAYAHEEDYNKAIAIGFDGYLTKPINYKALKIVLEDFFVME